jgi:hypothetical protein
MAETFLPQVGDCVPCPAGQVLESAFAIGLKGAFGMENALLTDPSAKLKAIDAVVPRDSCVTMAFDVVQKSAEPFLLPVGARRRRL